MTGVHSIIERVLNGDTEAYVEIIREHQHSVWRVVAAMQHDPQLAEDLVQQTFVDGYFNLKSFDRNADFGVWIKTIARNLVRQKLRSGKRESHRLDAYRERQLSLEEQDAGERREQLSSDLTECRKQLAGAALQALEMRYAQTRGFEDIAKTLGRSVEAVRQLLSRTRLALRDCLEKRGAYS